MALKITTFTYRIRTGEKSYLIRPKNNFERYDTDSFNDTDDISYLNYSIESSTNLNDKNKKKKRCGSFKIVEPGQNVDLVVDKTSCYIFTDLLR